jgi:hypothetical protein
LRKKSIWVSPFINRFASEKLHQQPALPAPGSKQLTKRETAKAQNKLQKRTASQASGGRFVGCWLTLVLT